MSENIDKALSAIDECLAGISPHDPPELIEEHVDQMLQESVEGGWRTQEEADRLRYQWLGHLATE